MGTSNLLIVLPIEEYGLTLTYNKTLKEMPSQYPCSQDCDVNHAMNWKIGGFVET